MAAQVSSDPPPPPAAAPELPALWDLDSAGYECDCPGPPPPPQFRLPPPPRPPYLQEIDCSDMPLPELETCDAVPVIDAEYHSSPAIPSIAVIVVCSLLLLVMVLIASVLVWKHKRKMQNFLPCKTSPQNRCEVPSGNGVIYEDLTNIRPRAVPNHCGPGQTAPSIEMIDVKSSPNFSAGFSVINHPSVFICPPPHVDAYTSQDLYNPVYEELSNGSGERGDSEPESEVVAGHGAASEDEFAEDELSLGDRDRRRPQRPPDGRRAPAHDSGHHHAHHHRRRDADLQPEGDDRGRFLASPPPPAPPDDRGPVVDGGFSLPPGCRSRSARRPQPRGSLDHNQQQQRRGWRGKDRGGDFHEGLLLDALLQLYPNVVTLGGGGGTGCRSPRGAAHHRLPYVVPAPAAPEDRLVDPYESVPVLGHLHHHHGVVGGGYRQAPPPDMFTTFRPGGGGKAPSQQDSDSGYSNNTSGGRTTSSRSRKDHRLSAHDVALS